VGNEARDDPSKGFQTVNGNGTGHDPKPCKIYDDDDDDDDDMSTYSTLVVLFLGGFTPHNFNNKRSITKVKNY
jgi:hypothetical protein